MPPYFASDDQRNQHLRDTKFACQFGGIALFWLMSLPNFLYLSIRQFGSVMLFSAFECFRVQARTMAIARCLSATSFGIHIQAIVSAGAKEQMRRIATATIITMMTNILAFRNRPIGQFPCDPMSAGNQAARSAESTISILGTCTKPRPALVWSGRCINFRVESLLNNTGSIY